VAVYDGLEGFFVGGVAGRARQRELGGALQAAFALAVAGNGNHTAIRRGEAGAGRGAQSLVGLEKVVQRTRGDLQSSAIKDVVSLAFEVSGIRLRRIVGGVGD